ncbi:hypothetical protein [Croceibacterium aestuarii]|uniref:hypothetical protein n=1 Tax=Croceibacterium aestuarii TaxID=3064139 RepID=UPI00272E0464|nr:hypothetical protein [Croceibacterium sp. D39]
MLEWIVAGAVFVVALMLLPRLLARAKDGTKKGGGGMMVALGLIFASAFDPARAAATEELDRRKDAEGEDEGESGGEP